MPVTNIGDSSNVNPTALSPSSSTSPCFVSWRLRGCCFGVRSKGMSEIANALTMQLMIPNRHKVRNHGLAISRGIMDSGTSDLNLQGNHGFWNQGENLKQPEMEKGHLRWNATRLRRQPH